MVKERPKSTLTEMIDYEIFSDKRASTKIVDTIDDLIDNASDEQIDQAINSYTKSKQQLTKICHILQATKRQTDLVNTDYTTLAKICRSAPKSSKAYNSTIKNVIKARNQMNAEVGRIIMNDYQHQRHEAPQVFIPKKILFDFKRAHPKNSQEAEAVLKYDNDQASKSINEFKRRHTKAHPYATPGGEAND